MTRQDDVYERPGEREMKMAYFGFRPDGRFVIERQLYSTHLFFSLGFWLSPRRYEAEI